MAIYLGVNRWGRVHSAETTEIIMTTITIQSDDKGQLSVSMDGGEPQPIQDVEQACQLIESAFGAGEQESPEEESGEGGQAGEDAEQAFSGGFNAVRQGGLNPQRGM